MLGSMCDKLILKDLPTSCVQENITVSSTSNLMCVLRTKQHQDCSLSAERSAVVYFPLLHKFRCEYIE
jgi:hypothetical protein